MVEAQENIITHIPYPELYAPEAIKRQLARDILLSPRVPQSKADKQVNTNKLLVSPIDLRRAPRELSGQEMLDAVSNHLGTSLGKIDEVPTTPEARLALEKQLLNVNSALRGAHDYLQHVLNLRVPEYQVRSKKDIVNLIFATTRYTAEYKRGLPMHAGYCALVSTALAVFELQRKEALTLAGEMNYLSRFLTESNESNGGVPLFTKHAIGEVGDVMNVNVNDVNPPCQARLSMRDKTPESQITKYLRKPEATAEAAQKDAIGLRLEVENSHIEDVLVKILNYLQQQMAARNISIEDRNLLDRYKDRLRDFKTRKSEEVHNGDGIPAVSDTSPLTADSYQGINITCNLLLPEGGNSPAKKFVSHAMEIQVVLPKSKNENGLSSHAVYELKKKITVMTRLFGGCSEKWLMDQTKATAQKEGFPSEFVRNTIQGLEKVGFMMRLPNTPNKKVFAANDVYNRWLRVDGLIENDLIRRQVAHKLRNERK
jgi:hypothetical protein